MRYAPFLLAAAAAVAVAVAVACSQPVVVQAAPEDQALAVEAFERWGAAVVFAPDAPVTFTVVRPDDLDGSGGRTERRSRCDVRVETINGPTFAAHEAGHALGLSHDDDRSNLMHERPVAVGAVVTAEQWDKAQRGAERLGRCP